MLTQISTSSTTVGPYSPAIIANNTIFTSGQLGFRDGVMPPSIIDQTNNVLINLKAVLEAGKSSIQQVYKCQIFIKKGNSQDIVIKIFNEYFNGCDVQKVVIEVEDIAAGAVVEIDAIGKIME
ncbi:Endoribonuclease L-PSP [Spironucleus salmonicida]|uniref:Endoribonuclease L-PSP n=1 Tax=Spironucleus salmonicida TaxID=348837 RepID=V6LFT2_9EUKA|nr:Endoribonuclease L-PSP [Spironucleus salmonicida]|eukprot:EST43148.1 Endoribonuclease L-PSP [Spironucleus salmonicida]